MLRSLALIPECQHWVSSIHSPSAEYLYSRRQAVYPTGEFFCCQLRKLTLDHVTWTCDQSHDPDSMLQTLTADRYGEEFVQNGVWDLRSEWKPKLIPYKMAHPHHSPIPLKLCNASGFFQDYGPCTAGRKQTCTMDGSHGILPPIVSGRIMSKTSIRYGKVEIIAKLPCGDWLWPGRTCSCLGFIFPCCWWATTSCCTAFWMLPKNDSYGRWPRSGEIDIMESRGNRQFGEEGVAYMSSTLHWGSAWNANRHRMTTAKKRARNGTLADGFHNYTLLWDPTGIQ